MRSADGGTHRSNGAPAGSNILSAGGRNGGERIHDNNIAAVGARSDGHASTVAAARRRALASGMAPPPARAARRKSHPAPPTELSPPRRTRRGGRRGTGRRLFGATAAAAGAARCAAPQLTLVERIGDTSRGHPLVRRATRAHATLGRRQWRQQRARSTWRHGRGRVAAK